MRRLEVEIELRFNLICLFGVGIVLVGVVFVLVDIFGDEGGNFFVYGLGVVVVDLVLEVGEWRMLFFGRLMFV